MLRGHLAFAPARAEESEGFEAGFFEGLARAEEGSFWFAARNHLIVPMLRRYFPRAATFLEVGCGTGFVLAAIRQAFPRLTLLGTEIHSAGLAFAQERLPGVTLLQMDARCIPFRSELDVIGAFDVLEHIAEDEDVLREMFAAIRPGGGIVLTVPQHRFLWSVADEYSHHRRRYARAELVGKVKRAGFEILRVTSMVALLLPLMYVSRRWQDPAKYDPLRELAIPPFLNGILEMIMRLEGALIRGGATFPVGGSLIVVARRG